MKKYKDLIIVIVILLIVGFGTYFLSKSSETKDFRKINYNKYVNLTEKKDEVLLYVVSTDSEDEMEEVKSFAKKNNLSFKYIYEKDLTAEQKKELGYDAGSIIIYNNDKKEEIYSGDFSETTLREFFEKLNLLDKTYITINVKQYVELINTEKFVVFIAREGCSYCDMYKPIVNKVIADNDIDIYQLDITNMTEEEYAQLLSVTSYLNEEEWGTPTTLIFNNGKMIDVLSGYVEQKALEDFLTTNGIL